MKAFYLISTLLFWGIFNPTPKIATIIGTVTDQDGKPIKGVTISISQGSSDNTTILTDKTGKFVSKNAIQSDAYFISADKSGYLSKTKVYRPKATNAADTIFVSLQLRHRKVATINTSQISDKDLGVTIAEAITKYKIDTTECSVQNEPPGIARGIITELGDSTIIYLQIERKANVGNHFSSILNEKVKGIGLAFPNCSKKQFGENFVWHGMHNPYCKNHKKNTKR